MPTHTSITDIIETCYCEQKVLLKHQHGPEPRSASAQAKLDAGQQRHIAYERAGHAARDQRCFIATQVFGPTADETNRLRAWRDTALLPSAAGRLFVACYYRLSPHLIGLLARSPLLSACIRAILRRWIARLERQQ